MPKIVVLRIFDDFSGDLIQLFQVSARYIPIFGTSYLIEMVQTFQVRVVDIVVLQGHPGHPDGVQMEWRKTSTGGFLVMNHLL